MKGIREGKFGRWKVRSRDWGTFWDIELENQFSDWEIASFQNLDIEEAALKLRQDELVLIDWSME